MYELIDVQIIQTSSLLYYDKDWDHVNLCLMNPHKMIYSHIFRHLNDIFSPECMLLPQILATRHGPNRTTKSPSFSMKMFAKIKGKRGGGNLIHSVTM